MEQGGHAGARSQNCHLSDLEIHREGGWQPQAALLGELPGPVPASVTLPRGSSPLQLLLCPFEAEAHSPHVSKNRARRERQHHSAGGAED